MKPIASHDFAFAPPKEREQPTPVPSFAGVGTLPSHPATPESPRRALVRLAGFLFSVLVFMAKNFAGARTFNGIQFSIKSLKVPCRQ